MTVAAETIRKAFRQRRNLFGAWTSLGHPSITEIFVKGGFDFMGMDLEHSTIDQAEAQRIIATSQAAGVACLPRVSSHNSEQIQRLLDSGADGIIVPNVRTVDEVERIVAWCKYPPIGERSYGVSRAQGYGFDFDPYVSSWNERSVLLIQIESREAALAAEKLLENPWVDGAMIGPYDLSGSMGLAGQLDHPQVAEACAHVMETCRLHGKACGTQLIDPSQAQVEASLDAGYTFVVLASDVFVLWKWSQRMRTLIKMQRQGVKVETDDPS